MVDEIDTFDYWTFYGNQITHNIEQLLLEKGLIKDECVYIPEGEYEIINKGNYFIDCNFNGFEIQISKHDDIEYEII